MRVEAYTESTTFPLLREGWNSLLARAPFDTIFLTWEWQSVWWESFGKGGQLLLLTIRDGEELIGLAPLYSVEDQGLTLLRLVGGIELSDYLDIVALQGREEEVWSAILSHLEEESPPWEPLDLHNLPAASSTRQLLPRLAPRWGLKIEEEVEDVCPLLELPGDWGQYLALLGGKQRHELRRKLRKAQREARVDWYIVREEEKLASEVDDFLTLHGKSSPEKEEFMDREMQPFFHQMAQTTFQAGWLRLGFLLTNGIKVASLLSFDYGDALLLYNSGYDPERYRDLSPGVLATAFSIEEAISQGKRVYDFLQGDEEYKYRFGAQDTHVYHLTVKRA